MSMSAFGKRFKMLRIEKDMSQEELVRDFNAKYGYNFTAPAISLYENNKRIPELDALNAFADYFKVTIDYLLGRTDNPEYAVLTKTELPKELTDLGYDYIEVLKDAKDNFTAEELKELIEFAKKIKNRS